MRKAAKKVQKSAASKKIFEKKPSNELTFNAFFDQCLRLGKLMPWQKREVEAFFKDNKLKNTEDLNTYLRILEKY